MIVRFGRHRPASIVWFAGASVSQFADEVLHGLGRYFLAVDRACGPHAFVHECTAEVVCTGAQADGEQFQYRRDCWRRLFVRHRRDSRQEARTIHVQVRLPLCGKVVHVYGGNGRNAGLREYTAHFDVGLRDRFVSCSHYRISRVGLRLGRGHADRLDKVSTEDAHGAPGD